MVSVVEKKTKEQLQEEQSRTLFIRNISGSLTIDDLEELVSQYCPVDSIFPLFGSDGSFSGTVCLVIHNEADLDGVIEYLNSVEHDGLSLECSAFDTTYKLKVPPEFVSAVFSSWTDEASAVRERSHSGGT